MKNQITAAHDNFRGQTEMVFVLGAGASFEVGLPVGEGLKKEITSLLEFSLQDGQQQKNGDQTIIEAFRQITAKDITKDFNKILVAARNIRNAMPQALSIDNFLDVHNENKYIELAGKLAITKAILKAESKSSLHMSDQDSSMNFNNLSSTWFNKFFQSVSENCKFSDLKTRLKKITIISFNYDRCLKQFMRHAIQNYYCVDTHDAEETVSHLEILYPYGSTGNLSSHKGPGIDFGANLNALKLLEISNQIKTFTERIDENSRELTRIRYCLEKTKQIIFLGFAYHPLNMDLLFPKDNFENKECGVLGTALGISFYDLQSIKNDIMTRLGTADVALDAVSCYDLYGSRWRTLSMTK